MAWILKNGVTTEEEVPYEAMDSTCTANVAPAHSPNTEVLAQLSDSPASNLGTAFGLMSWQTLQSNADYPLAEAVVKYGPVAVSAAASGWYEYSHGIFDGCGSDFVVDHAIVLYGYGKEGQEKYWLIRNSWGRDWGEGGFIRLLRHDDDQQHCGTDNDPAQGTGCKGGPSSVTVCGTCGVLYDSVVPHFAGAPRTNSSASIKTMVQPIEHDTSSLAAATSPASSHEAVDAVVRLTRREVRRHDGLA
jgi:hypothetical protein